MESGAPRPVNHLDFVAAILLPRLHAPPSIDCSPCERTCAAPALVYLRPPPPTPPPRDRRRFFALASKSYLLRPRLDGAQTRPYLLGQTGRRPFTGIHPGARPALALIGPAHRASIALRRRRPNASGGLGREGQATYPTPFFQFQPAWASMRRASSLGGTPSYLYSSFFEVDAIRLLRADAARRRRPG